VAGFTKVTLKAGASQQVTIPLTSRDISIWDTSSHSFQEVKGTFQAYLGASSRDHAFTGSFVN
jgi:beta-glucosidase